MDIAYSLKENTKQSDLQVGDYVVNGKDVMVVACIDTDNASRQYNLIALNDGMYWDNHVLSLSELKEEIDKYNMSVYRGGKIHIEFDKRIR